LQQYVETDFDGQRSSNDVGGVIDEMLATHQRFAAVYYHAHPMDAVLTNMLENATGELVERHR
jgi:hypothetical protein